MYSENIHLSVSDGIMILNLLKIPLITSIVTNSNRSAALLVFKAMPDDTLLTFNLILYNKLNNDGY